MESYMYGVNFFIKCQFDGCICAGLKTVTNYFLLNLAVADIFITVFCTLNQVTIWNVPCFIFVYFYIFVDAVLGLTRSQSDFDGWQEYFLKETAPERLLFSHFPPTVMIGSFDKYVLRLPSKGKPIKGKE